MDLLEAIISRHGSAYATDVSIDCSDALADCVAQGHVHIPVRHDSSGAVIPYRAADVEIGSDVSVHCDGPNAWVKGYYSGETIFKTTGSASQIQIIGGTWTNSEALLRTVGTLSVATFERCIINGMDACLDIDAAVAVTVDRCHLRGSDDALIFGGTGAANGNAITGCRVYDCTRGVTFDGVTQHIGNTIRDTVFDAVTAGAIIVDGYGYGLTVEQCYFEPGDSATAADVQIGDDGAPSKDVRLLGCFFGPAGTTIASRIAADGAAQVSVQGGYARLNERTSGIQALIDASGASLDSRCCDVVLHGNFPNHDPKPDYADAAGADIVERENPASIHVVLAA